MDRSFAPPEGAIERGTVAKIEPYGAFVQLDRYRSRGLVHISELESYRVENVEDAVSINDVVWVKVLEVKVETDESGKRRHKLRLSKKSASQDGTAQDLEQAAQVASSSHSRLEQSLNSSIGMGVALDPMATMSSGMDGSKLVLKHGKSNATVINGYALVDDTEGEPEQPVMEAKPVVSAAPVVRPMGRGRGTTLPAWMTRGDDVGMKDSVGSNDSGSKRKKRKHKEKKRHERRRESRSKRHKRHKKEHRKHRRRSRSRSVSDYDSENSMQHRKEHRKRRRRSRSRSVSDDDSENSMHSKDANDQFANVEEAKKYIADVERKRRR